MTPEAARTAVKVILQYLDEHDIADWPDPSALVDALHDLNALLPDPLDEVEGYVDSLKIEESRRNLEAQRWAERLAHPRTASQLLDAVRMKGDTFDFTPAEQAIWAAIPEADRQAAQFEFDVNSEIRRIRDMRAAEEARAKGNVVAAFFYRASSAGAKWRSRLLDPSYVEQVTQEARRRLQEEGSS
jgi:hypothetical protein